MNIVVFTSREKKAKETLVHLRYSQKDEIHR